MALMKKLKNLRTNNSTGFGDNSNSTGGRFITKDGKANVIKRGVGILNRYSWYHTMLEMNRGKFLFLLFVTYITVNLLFAGIYYLIGINHLAGVNTGSPWKNFTEVFFFSAQTITTVGYGNMHPDSIAANCVATFESVLAMAV